MFWVVASAIGLARRLRRQAAALGSALGSRDPSVRFSTAGSAAAPSKPAMPVVPGLAQAAIRRPASVSYATVAWVGRAAPYVGGTRPQHRIPPGDRDSAARRPLLPTCRDRRIARRSVLRSQLGSPRGHRPRRVGPRAQWRFRESAVVGHRESRDPWARAQRTGRISGHQRHRPRCARRRPVVRSSRRPDAIPAGDLARIQPCGERAWAPNPENISDAASAAARYLCASDVDLRTPTGLIDALYGYNHSFAYVTNVITAAQRYAEGTLQGASGALEVLPALLYRPADCRLRHLSCHLPAGLNLAGTVVFRRRNVARHVAEYHHLGACHVVGVSSRYHVSIRRPHRSLLRPMARPRTRRRRPLPRSPVRRRPTRPRRTRLQRTRLHLTRPHLQHRRTRPPDTSAPDTPSPTPSLAPTPSLTPTPSLAPTPTPAPTQPTTPTPTITSTPTPTPVPTTSGESGNLGPTNTGVPAGTQLTVYNGNLTITTRRRHVLWPRHPRLRQSRGAERDDQRLDHSRRPRDVHHLTHLRPVGCGDEPSCRGFGARAGRSIRVHRRHRRVELHRTATEYSRHRRRREDVRHECHDARLVDPWPGHLRT